MNVLVVGEGPMAVACRAAVIAADHTLAVTGATPLDALVFAPWNPATAPARSLADLTDEEFDAAWQQTMDAAVAACIDARSRMADGGSIVLTTPTIGQSGGARYAHWSAAAEGVRVLAKSAARQWGADRIAVNAIAFDPAFALADPSAVGAVSIASPALPADIDEVARFVVAIATGPRTATGQTITADGGVWMS